MPVDALILARLGDYNEIRLEGLQHTLPEGKRRALHSGGQSSPPAHRLAGRKLDRATVAEGFKGGVLFGPWLKISDFVSSFFESERGVGPKPFATAPVSV